jgi:hypothetical protein
MPNHAIVEAGVVINVVVWDGVADFGLAADQTAVPIDDLDPVPGIDWTYDGATFTPPPISLKESTT